MSEEDYPQVIYHYTSINTFKAIVSKGIMRASRIDQMNDHGEYKFGLQRMLDSLKAQEPSEQQQPYIKHLSSQIDSVSKATVHSFVACFSATKDSLEQWRAYCPEGGVAIGFEPASMWKSVILNSPTKGEVSPNSARQVKLLECLYSNRDGKYENLSCLSDPLVKQGGFNQYFKDVPVLFELRQPLQIHLLFKLLEAVSQLKHGAFEGENEWRLVKNLPDGKEFPVKLSQDNRFYIELPFTPKDCIREVWISPHGDSTGAHNAIEFMKKEHGLNLEIKESTIPYRVGS